MNAAVWSKNGKWLMGVTLVTMSTLACAQSFHEWHGSGLRGDAGYPASRNAAAGRWYGERGAPGPRTHGLRIPRGNEAERAGRASRRVYDGGAGESGGYGMHSRYDGYPAGGGAYGGGYGNGGYGNGYGGGYGGNGGYGPAPRPSRGNGAPPANYRFGASNGEPRDPAQRAGSIREDVTRYNEEHGAARSPARGGNPYQPMPPASYRN